MLGTPNIHIKFIATTWTVSCQAPCPWNSPGKDTRVSSHSLLQGIFLTQGLDLGLLHCRQICYHPSHQKSPNITICVVKILKSSVVIDKDMLFAALCPTPTKSPCTACLLISPPQDPIYFNTKLKFMSGSLKPPEPAAHFDWSVHACWL